MQYAALLWDMDGTLFDTYPMMRRNIKRVFAAHGAAVDPIQVARLLAITFDDCIETLAEQHHLDVALLRTEYRELLHSDPAQQPPFPGVIDLCQRVVSAGSQNLIMTHRGHQSLHAFLDHYAMSHLFTDTITVDQGYPRKPDPTAFLTIAGRLGIDPASVLAVGDRDLDMQAGTSAGMRTCFFTPDDFPGGAPQPTIKTDMIVGSYAELARLLGL